MVIFNQTQLLVGNLNKLLDLSVVNLLLNVDNLRGECNTSEHENDSNTPCAALMSHSAYILMLGRDLLDITKPLLHTLSVTISLGNFLRRLIEIGENKKVDDGVHIK